MTRRSLGAAAAALLIALAASACGEPAPAPSRGSGRANSLEQARQRAVELAQEAASGIAPRVTAAPGAAHGALACNNAAGAPTDESSVSHELLLDFDGAGLRKTLQAAASYWERHGLSVHSDGLGTSFPTLYTSSRDGYELQLTLALDRSEGRIVVTSPCFPDPAVVDFTD